MQYDNLMEPKMKKKDASIVVFLAATILGIVLTSCKKDPPDFQLTSLMTGTIDLNVSPPPVTIPVNPVIEAFFSSNLDSNTADPANISLIRDYDGSSVGISVTSKGEIMTITPVDELSPGALYRLILKAGIKSTAGLALTELVFPFTTLGTFVPPGEIAYWNFEGNANDQIGTYHPTINGIVDIVYAESRNARAGKAADFNGTSSIIEIPNGEVLMNTPNFTLSLWLKTNSTDHHDENQNPAGYFVIGLAAFFGFEFEISPDFSSCKLAARYGTGGGSVSEDLLFPGDGKNKDNGGWQGWEFCRNLTGSGGVAALLRDKWAQIVYTYEASSMRGILYINGEKMKIVNFSLWPEGNDRRNITGLKYSGSFPETVNELAFGFIQSRAGTFFDSDPRYGYDFPTSNHFKGQLDDIRVFHKVLTETEIQLMYNSENQF